MNLSDLNALVARIEKAFPELCKKRMKLHTINALPDGERVHALFLGYHDEVYGFEVTHLGTVGIPKTHLRRVGDLCGMVKGEDVNLKLDGVEDVVIVWRVS